MQQRLRRMEIRTFTPLAAAGCQTNFHQLSGSDQEMVSADPHLQTQKDDK